MNLTNSYEKVLELVSGPAFTVKDGNILQCNREARACLLEPGTPIAPLLLTGVEEYGQLTDGCLSLRIQAANVPWDATVTRLDGVDLFRLERESVPAEVKAMAHMSAELRYPVSTLSILTDHLLADRPNAPEAVSFHQAFSRILRLLNNATNTERFLTASHPNLEEMDACAIIREVLEESGSLLEHAGFRLDISLPERPVYTVLDEHALRQAVYNLLSNAAKFSPPGGLIRVSASMSGSRLYLCVSDQGDGIPTAHRGGVFTRFAREYGVEEGRQNLGLGLALVRAVAAIHSGAVLVDAPEGKGTRVTMTIALRQSATPTLRSPNKLRVINSADEALIMLSDALPQELYKLDK